MTKPFFLSKTFWGLFLAGAAKMAESFGLLAEGTSDTVAAQLVEVAGMALAFYGRWVAKAPLSAS